MNLRSEKGDGVSVHQRGSDRKLSRKSPCSKGSRFPKVEVLSASFGTFANVAGQARELYFALIKDVERKEMRGAREELLFPW